MTTEQCGVAGFGHVLSLLLAPSGFSGYGRDAEPVGRGRSDHPTQDSTRSVTGLAMGVVT